jgi:cell division protein FtsL
VALLHRPAILSPRAFARQRPGLVIAAIAVTLVVVVAAFQVSQFSSLTNTSYEINELNRVRAEKQARNHALEAEVASLSSLARVDLDARLRLGLQPAAKIIHVDVNQPLPADQSLPTRFLPREPEAEYTEETPLWRRLIRLLPLF